MRNPIIVHLNQFGDWPKKFLPKASVIAWDAMADIPLFELLIVLSDISRRRFVVAAVETATTAGGIVLFIIKL